MIKDNFFHWVSPKKLRYGKPRLGESTLTYIVLDTPFWRTWPTLTFLKKITLYIHLHASSYCSQDIQFEIISLHLLEECACELLESGLRADFRLGLREVSRTFDVRILPIFTCNIITIIMIFIVIIIAVIIIVISSTIFNIIFTRFVICIIVSSTLPWNMCGMHVHHYHSHHHHNRQYYLQHHHHHLH